MRRISFTVLTALAISLMSCENPMTMRTKINEDGSLDKVIVFEKADAKIADTNVFGVNSKNGWALIKTKRLDSASTKSDKQQFRIQFSKHFDNDAQFNADLDKNSDTLFRIHARFENKFRWFYTYIRYSETIRPLHRFRLVSSKDFFTQEDDAFIRRLPAEGRPISKADSVYLLLLNEKIGNNFANMGIFKEAYPILEEVIRRNLKESKWLDTLYKNQEFIYRLIEKDKIVENFTDKIADSLKIPLPKQRASHDYDDLSKSLNARLGFMGFVRDGKYQNEFEMPWTVITSNADSVNGNKLYWRPVANKFVYLDYEMFAESRKINWWAIAVSLVIVGLTLVVFRKKSP